MGIEESKEMLKFIELVVDDVVEGKKPLQIGLENLPAGVKAFMGADQIDDELKDLDAAERDELLMMAMPIFKKLAGMAL
jgi:hypothetical protein